MSELELPWGPPKRGAGQPREDETAELRRTAGRVAEELAQKHGAVHSQMVIAELAARGAIPQGSEAQARQWVGCVFRDSPVWETGGYVTTATGVRKLHKLAGAPDPVGFDLLPRQPQDGPAQPSAQDIAFTIAAYRHALHVALGRGYRPPHPEAMTRVGCWLRHLAGEDVTEELPQVVLEELDPVGTCSVCGEPQYDTVGGPVCSQGHGGAPSVEDG